MLAKIRSASVVGIDAHPVEVEVDITSRGLPHFRRYLVTPCLRGNTIQDPGQGRVLGGL